MQNHFIEGSKGDLGYNNDTSQRKLADCMFLYTPVQYNKDNMNISIYQWYKYKITETIQNYFIEWNKGNLG